MHTYYVIHYPIHQLDTEEMKWYDNYIGKTQGETLCLVIQPIRKPFTLQLL